MKFDNSMVQYEGRFNRIAAQIGEPQNDLFHFRLVDADQSRAGIDDTVSQITTVGIVGESNKMFGQAFLVVGNGDFPVQFVHLVRYGFETGV